MSKLLQAQMRFSQLLGEFLVWIYQQPGLAVTMGECLRPPEMQDMYIKSGRSWTKNSLHLQKLAVDISLFKDGIFQNQTEAYQLLGEYWQSLDSHCRWGGGWTKTPDGNHFEYRI